MSTHYSKSSKPSGGGSKNKRKAEALLSPVEEAPKPPVAAPSDESDSEDEAAASNSAKKPSAPVIILLDQARLETVKTRKGDFELLNCDDHKDLLKKNKKDHKDYRPDIAHQMLLAIIDSPLNKAGKLKVYMRTSKNVLIEFNAAVRIPRTYKRFSGLVVQLLHKFKIKAANTNTTLLKVIKNPFHNHLPAGCRVYGLSVTGTLYNPSTLADELLCPSLSSSPLPSGAASPVCLVVGAMPSGSVTKDDHPYIERMFSISDYPLSGACAVSRIVGAAEMALGIV